MELFLNWGLALDWCLLWSESSSRESQYPHVLDNLTNQFIINDLQRLCSVSALDWGCQAIIQDAQGRTPALLVASDVFYDPLLFEDLLQTVSFLIKRDPNLVFLTAYQERSSKRSLTPVLTMYGLKGTLIANGQDILDKMRDEDGIELEMRQGMTANTNEMSILDYESTDSSLVSEFMFAITASGYTCTDNFISLLTQKY